MPDRAPLGRVPNARGRGDRLRHDLVGAARELLLTARDVTPLSLRAVAKAVGVSPAAVYLHFASAAELIDAVLRDQADSLRDGVATGSLLDLDAASMAEVGLRYVRWGLANPGGYQLLFESADRLGQQAGPGSPGWDMIETFGAALARAGRLSDHDADALAIRAWSALHGIVSLRIHKPGLGWPTSVEEEVADLAARLFGDGAAGPGD